VIAAGLFAWTVHRLQNSVVPMGGAIALVGAFIYAELADRMPQVGGQYAYLRQAYHPAVGFLYGWVALLVIHAGGTAAVVVTFAKYFQLILTGGSEKITAVTVIVALTVVNCMGVRAGGSVQNVFMIFRILAISTVVLCGAWFIWGSPAAPHIAWQPLSDRPASFGLLSAFGHNPTIGIRDYEGQIQFVPDSYEKSFVRLLVQTGAMEVLDEMKNDDRKKLEQVMFDEVLNVKLFPTAVFESKDITVQKLDNSDLVHARVTGDLTFHGMTQTHSFDARVNPIGNMMRISGEFPLRLSDYGIKPVSFFVNRLTRFAGKVSYSIYLLHPSTILFLFPVYRWIYGAGFPLTVSFLACYAVTLAVVISLAAITFRWIEKPGMRLGKRLIERLSMGESTPPVRVSAPAP